jgi:hypothetical protein
VSTPRDDENSTGTGRPLGGRGPSRTQSERVEACHSTRRIELELRSENGRLEALVLPQANEKLRRTQLIALAEDIADLCADLYLAGWSPPSDVE